MSAQTPRTTLTADDLATLRALLSRLTGAQLPERCTVLVSLNDDQVAARPYVLWREREREAAEAMNR